MAAGVGVTFTDGAHLVGFGHNGIGDINNDGYDDFAISRQNSPGMEYVVFGSNTLNSSNTFNLSGLDGVNGFKVTATNSTEFFG
jgi:hypothetical protein